MLFRSPESTGKKLTAAQIETLKKWVQQGAEFQGHWSFLKVERPQAPKLADESRVAGVELLAGFQHDLAGLGVDQVDEVDNASDALRLLGTKNYGVILSDWHMQPMSGLELLKHVRKHKHGVKPKFAFLSMDDRWSNITTARSLGADAFIVKPDNPRALRGKIGAFMSTRV